MQAVGYRLLVLKGDNQPLAQLSNFIDKNVYTNDHITFDKPIKKLVSYPIAFVSSPDHFVGLNYVFDL